MIYSQNVVRTCYLKVRALWYFIAVWCLLHLLNHTTLLSSPLLSFPLFNGTNNLWSKEVPFIYFWIFILIFLGLTDRHCHQSEVWHFHAIHLVVIWMHRDMSQSDHNSHFSASNRFLLHLDSFCFHNFWDNLFLFFSIHYFHLWIDVVIGDHGFWWNRIKKIVTRGRWFNFRKIE